MGRQLWELGRQLVRPPYQSLARRLVSRLLGWPLGQQLVRAAGELLDHHVGFGGGGAHFCLGANLARREIAVAFEELRRRIPDIEVTEEPAMLLSAFIHGIKKLPVSWTPPSR